MENINSRVVPSMHRDSLIAPSMVEEVEGELKRIKSFWSSQKDIYRLKFPYMMVRRTLKNNNHEFKNKYDLKLYTIRLSNKEKCIFFLDPKQDYFRLDRLEFQTKTAEERAQWYLAITKCYKDDEMAQH